MSIYKHVVVVGIDGMGVFNRTTNTPNFDRIFKDGATTYDGLSMYPTISAENWGAMLLGTAPAVHGMTNESLNEEEHADDSPLPSVFRILRGAYPDAKLASFCDWHPINYGILEQGYNFHFVHERLEPLADQIGEYLKKEKPMLLFSQFDHVDGGGHDNGYGSHGHLEQIEKADYFCGKVYDAMVEAGMADDTLFLVITDHGGTPDGEHGGWSTNEKYIFFGAAGKDVPHGQIGTLQTCDLAAIILHALGVEVPAYNPEGWTSQVPAGIFSEPVAPYIESEQLHAEHIGIPTPDIDDPEIGLKKKTPTRVKLHSAYFFDGNLNDSMGNTTTLSDGRVKLYSHGVRGSFAEFGRTGSLIIENPPFAGDFTIGLWVLACGSLRAVLYGNGDTDHPEQPGFTMVVDDHYYVFTIGNGKDCMRFRFRFTETYDGWTHLFVSVDRAKREIHFGRGFQEMGIVSYDASYDVAFDTTSPFRVGDDTTGQKNANHLFPADDLLLFADALNFCEYRSIGRYYGL